MKLTIAQAYNAGPHLKHIMNLGLKAKILYNLSKIQKVISEEAANYDKVRIARLEELSEKDENGKSIITKEGSYQLSVDNQSIFQEEMEVLQRQEVEIVGTPIQIKDIEDVVGLTATTFNVLDWLFVE